MSGYTEYEWRKYVSSSYYVEPTYTTEYEWACRNVSGTEYQWACTTQSGSPTQWQWNVTYIHDGTTSGHVGNYSYPASPGSATYTYWGSEASSGAPLTRSISHTHNGASMNHTYNRNSQTKTGTTSGGYTYSTTYTWSSSNTSSPCGSVYSSSVVDSRTTYNTTYSWSTSNTYSPCPSAWSTWATGASRSTQTGGGYYQDNSYYDYYWSTSNTSPPVSGAELTGTTRYIDTESTPTAPGAFTSPTAGTLSSGPTTVAHGPASDADNDPLTYDADLSLNGGSTWVAKRVKAAGTSFTYDYTNDQPTTNARWRARAWDTKGYGPYATSSDFTVRHNVAPTAPTPVSPADNVSMRLSKGGTIAWSVNDGNGDPQNAFAFRRVRGGTVTEWWNGTVWVTSETWVVSSTQSVTFPSGRWPPGKYTYQVATRDPSLSVSPYYAARTVTVPPNYGMVV